MQEFYAPALWLDRHSEKDVIVAISHTLHAKVLLCIKDIPRGLHPTPKTGLARSTRSALALILTELDGHDGPLASCLVSSPTEYIHNGILLFLDHRRLIGIGKRHGRFF